MKKLTFLLACLLSCAAFAQTKKIVVTTEYPPEFVADLNKTIPGVNVVRVQPNQEMEAIVDADAFWGNVNPAKFKAAKKLKWISLFHAGVENLMYPELVNSSVILTNSKIVQGPEISEHAMGLLLALTRNISEYITNKPSESWHRSAHPPVELRGKTAVIVGVGGIGSQIALKAWACGMHVIGVDPKDVSIQNYMERVVSPQNLDEVLPEANVLFVSAPLTPQTKGMIGEKQFEELKAGSYFICVSRGGLYDTDALVKALDSKHLAGAGVDVTNPEPLPKGHPLWKFPNVIITPHVAGVSDGEDARKFYVHRENLRRFVRGDMTLINMVDKQKGY